MQKRDFVRLCEEKYGDAFDYSFLPETVKRSSECIVCKKHGKFSIIPRDHLRSKYGCPRCASEMSKKDDVERNEGLVAKAKLKHGDKFDYSLVDYESPFNQKVEIICPIHGKFRARLKDHLHSEFGCNQCGREANYSRRFKYSDLDDVASHGAKVHGEKYSYLAYDRETKVVTWKCPKHGTFRQDVNSHIRGHGCKKCSYLDRTISQEEFLKRAREVHPNGYEYNLDELQTVNDKITIHHECGNVYRSRVSNHLSGQGCRRCRSSLGEKKIREFLEFNGIEFKEQYRLDHRPYLFDFYLQNLGILIEFDGEQHFRPVDFFGGEKAFENRQRIDKEKDWMSWTYGCKLIRIPYTKIDCLEEYLSWAIDSHFHYRVGKAFYRNFTDLCKANQWPGETSMSEVDHLRTFKSLDKPA